MKNTFACTGCGKELTEMNARAHIKNCEKYDSFYLKKFRKFDTSDDINQIKCLAEQLALAKDYLDSLVLKKLKEINGVNGFDFGLMPENKQQKKDSKIKKNQSEFIMNEKQKQIKNNSQILSVKKDPFFEPQEQKQKNISDQKNKNYLNDGQKQQMGMKKQQKMGYQSESNMRMRQFQMYQLQEEQNIIDSYGLQYGEEIFQCPLCRKKFYTNYQSDKLQMIEQCWHNCCKVCIKKYVEDEFLPTSGFPSCPTKKCQNIIPEHQTKRILGQKFQILQNKMMSGLTNIVQCIQCKSKYDFVPGNPNDAPKKGPNGKPLDPKYAILYSQQRFVCFNGGCKTQQCKDCQVVPYHLGMTCQQNKAHALMKKCRFCNEPITQKNFNKSAKQALSDICNSQQCQKLAQNACTKILPCSHPCSGVKNQLDCLPCLKQNCCEKQPSLKGQKGSDYCAICYYDGLEAAPSIQCGCGHIFHFHCLKKRMQVKWLTPRILFNFCVCPLCKAWIQVPPESQLYQPVKQMKQLHDKIEKMALDRLKFEECEKDQKLTNKESPYFNKPKQYAMAIYAYFMCFKCKKPYFGGRKNCAQVMNNQQNAQGFNQKELICPGCCDIPIDNCPKHGNDFIEFKCKYCCSIAQWFCWGNTHFCEPCHKRQCNGDYVSKYTKDQLPKCQGPGKCPIGGKHGQNGQQKMLGCAICRNYKQNSKNF